MEAPKLLEEKAQDQFGSVLGMIGYGSEDFTTIKEKTRNSLKIGSG